MNRDNGDNGDNDGDAKPVPVIETAEGNGRKRKRESVDHYANAYQKIHFEEIPPQPQDLQIAGLSETVHSNNPPGTPLSQFAHSFHARFMDRPHDHHQQQQQIIHKCSNGLAIVTAGSNVTLLSSSDIQAIDFVIKTAEACSAGERRKRQSKMLKKGKVNQKQPDNSRKNNSASAAQGVVTPETEIVRIVLRNGTVLPVYACVWGSILELNTTITPAQLVQDPLMDGYLAIILPTGPFPPKKEESNDTSTESANKVNDSATASN